MAPDSPSLRDQIASFLGDDWDSPESIVRRDKPKRLPIQQALLTCPALEIIAASDAGKELAVAVLEDGSTVVLPDICPHDGGLLSDGFVEGNRIVCARHGWEFDGHSGQCAHKPGIIVQCTVFAEASGPTES